jgi:hypothetical protein
MSNSPAWDDINPALPPSARPHAYDLRAAAHRIRKLADFAAQLTHEGQLDRALSYLDQARDILKELK